MTFWHRRGVAVPRRAARPVSFRLVTENSKPQDSAHNAAPKTTPSERVGEPASKVKIADATGTAETAAVADTAATAGPSIVTQKGGPRRAASLPDSGSSSSRASSTKIRVDDAAEPMRAAGRLPRLPSDDEIAADLTQDSNEVDTSADLEAAPNSMTTARTRTQEMAKRQAAMDRAANTKPVLTRVFQVLIAVFYPIVLLVLSIRLVTSSVFLWVEYHRPGFPADSFGFSTEDRMTYGSYTIDYLLNFSPPRYLGDLVNNLGNPLFLTREVGHMADVKGVIVMAFLAGLVLAVIMIIGMVYLAGRSVGGIRRALFAGSIATLALILALGVLAVTGWEQFFTEFHRIFFADGTWTFYTDDTLIRLFPSQFWMDAGIFIGVFVLVVSSLTLAFTWPTKDRRLAVGAAQRPGRRSV